MKVHARKVTIDNIVFDSVHASEVYSDLKLQQRAGLISKLQCHPQFTFIVNGLPIAKMKPDFTFHDKEDRLHVLDAKGFKRSKKTGRLLPRVDREFGIKAKLMKACFGLEIEIV